MHCTKCHKNNDREWYYHYASCHKSDCNDKCKRQKYNKCNCIYNASIDQNHCDFCHMTFSIELSHCCQCIKNYKTICHCSKKCKTICSGCNKRNYRFDNDVI